MMLRHQRSSQQSPAPVPVHPCEAVLHDGGGGGPQVPAATPSVRQTFPTPEQQGIDALHASPVFAQVGAGGVDDVVQTPLVLPG